MKNIYINIKQILKDKIVAYSLKTFIASYVILFTVSIWKWKFLPPQIPLLYTLPRGEEQLVVRNAFLAAASFPLFIYLINLLISALFFWPKEKLITRLLLSIAGIVTILITITYVKIILLIT